MSSPSKSSKQGSSASSAKQLSFSVSGILDADYQFPELPKEPLEEITVDWHTLEYVNSIGIVRWLKWVHDVRQSQPGVRFQFVECPLFLVHIMNTVRGFLPKNSTVVSFEVPFQCDKCGLGDSETRTVCMEKGKSMSSLTMEEVREKVAASCQTTGCGLELDCSPTFFVFLKNNY